MREQKAENTTGHGTAARQRRITVDPVHTPCTLTQLEADYPAAARVGEARGRGSPGSGKPGVGEARGRGSPGSGKLCQLPPGVRIPGGRACSLQ
eukprot:COSAG01_NODE_6887_length_3453_cov_94.174873_7_plen_94_part_00